MASSLKYVIVKWTSGKDNGDMTVIEFDWVRGGENLEFDRDGRPAVSDDKAERNVMVEWRVGKTNKKQGWELHPAVIIMACRKCDIYSLILRL